MLSELQAAHLEYDRLPVEFYSTAGVRQVRWVRVGMPRIPQQVLNSVFYLYRSADDARAGLSPGRSGFVVTYGRPWAGAHFLYAVSNWHVVCREGFSILRLNKKDGGTDIIEFDPADWEFIPNSYDLAAVSINIDAAQHEVTSISTDMFLPPPDGRYDSLFGVGDDIFMVGLFVDHDGVSRNVPNARFGNVSMLPNKDALIEHPNGFRGVSYVVDMHSRTGFSGSPVFVYRTFGTDLERGDGYHFDRLEADVDGVELSVRAIDHGRASIRGGGGKIRAANGRLYAGNELHLLGILWGTFPEEW